MWARCMLMGVGGVSGLCVGYITGRGTDGWSSEQGGWCGTMEKLCEDGEVRVHCALVCVAGVAGLWVWCPTEHRKSGWRARWCD